MKLFLILLALSTSLWGRTNGLLCELIAHKTSIPAYVEGIPDGDTVKVRIHLGEQVFINNVRLLGIDTPEKNYQGYSQGYWAERATKSLEEMLWIGTKVILEFENKPCDAYRRLVARVKSHRYEVNLEQIRRGLAVTYCYQYVTQTCIRYSRALKDVMDKKLGMFSDPSLVLPYIFRNQVNQKARTRYVMNLETREVFGFEEVYRIPPHLIVFIPWSQ